jgi:hypothetical protein
LMPAKLMSESVCFGPISKQRFVENHHRARSQRVERTADPSTSVGMQVVGWRLP